MGALQGDAHQDSGERDQRKDALPQPHFSTEWHYQAGFGPDSPRL
jgi:hypothetical protein